MAECEDALVETVGGVQDYERPLDEVRYEIGGLKVGDCAIFFNFGLIFKQECHVRKLQDPQGCM